MRRTSVVWTIVAMTAASVPDAQTVTLPEGFPLKAALEQRLPVDRKPGRVVRARLVEPVYQGNRLVIPEGAELVGRVVAVGGVNAGRRVDALLRADFTPLRSPEIGFTELLVPGRAPERIRTSAQLDDGRMVRFAPPGARHGLMAQIKERIAETAAGVKQWLRSPGKGRSLADFVEIRLPLHPQWLPAGTRIEADLAAPAEVEAEAGAPDAGPGEGLPAAGAVAYARLLTPLDSATARYGQEVEAEFTRPLMSPEGGVLLPEGTRLEGTVSQARAARRFGRGGQLRFRFQEVVRPDGTRESIAGTLAGVAAKASERLKVDAEGGATAQADKSRTLSTLFALRSAFDPDGDSFVWSSVPGDNPGGIGFLGMVAAIATGRGSGIPLAFGAYNFTHALYTHWLARGREVSYRRNTAIELRLAGGHRGGSGAGALKSAAETPGKSNLP